MKEVKMTPKLREFLIKEKILKRFKKNADKSLVDAEFTFHDIAGTFLWIRSPEGADFWEKVSTDFIKYCKS